MWYVKARLCYIGAQSKSCWFQSCHVGVTSDFLDRVRWEALELLLTRGMECNNAEATWEALGVSGSWLEVKCEDVDIICFLYRTCFMFGNVQISFFLV